MTIGRLTLTPSEASLLEILESRARTEPDRQLFCFLDEGEFETEKLSYAQLERRSQALAAEIQQSTHLGDRVVLLYPPGLEFISALFGCFYAGVVAVPVQPPRLDLQDAGLQRLARIVKDSQPALILTGGTIADSMLKSCASWGESDSPRCSRTDTIDDVAANAFRRQTIGRDTVALLQYTSGSTGDPRGVVITHGNILANQHVLQLAFHHRTALRPGTGVCWLPFYHDMGLIGNVLQAVYVDAPCYLMSPLILLQRPLRWLEAISRYRAHSSGGPNFAYDLCVQRISEEQKEKLDLSCWEVAAIGAEIISHRTMDRFTEAFAVCGFRREAFYPCYGLAEATLFVSGGDKEEVPTVRSFRACDIEYHPDGARLAEPDDSLRPGAIAASSLNDHAELGQTLVGCGRAWTDHEIVIVDPRTQTESPPGNVGEIWFRGPSVAQGYWHKDEETKHTFSAHLSISGRGPFLRTGDLGFISNGELFISGRIKDLIVIRGHNHYPQDIEETVSRLHEAFRPNAGAACGCPGDGEERLVILQEINRQTRQLNVQELTRVIRREVAERHQLQVHEVIFLYSGTLPRTTNGKVRRNECRRQYLKRQLTPWKANPRRSNQIPMTNDQARTDDFSQS